MISSFVLIGGVLLSTQAFASRLQCKNILAPSDEIKNIILKKFIETPKKDMAILARSIFQTIENNYGPLQLKKETIGLNYQEAKLKFFKDINNIKSESELLFKFSNFLFQFKDSHVSINLPSSLTWKLPMQVSYVFREKKYILNAIDRESLKDNLISGELPPLGAELVAVNGSSVEKFRYENKYFNHEGNELASQALFGTRLFRISESYGLPLSLMENNGWSFEFKSTDAGGMVLRKVVQLKYNVEGVGLIDSHTDLSAVTLNLNSKKEKIVKEERLDSNSVVETQLSKKIHHLFNAVVDGNFEASERKKRHLLSDDFKKLEGNLYQIGQAKPLFKLPNDFSEIKLPEFLSDIFDEEDIFAGTFEHNGKKVGLLRIPTYAISDNSVRIAPLVIDYLVRRLEASSDYLILDQMHNPGGAVVYTDFWINALVGNFNLNNHLHFKVKPTSGFIQQFAEIYSKLNELAVKLPAKLSQPMLQRTRDQLEIVQEAYRSGQALSDPITLLPMSQLIQLSIFMNKMQRAYVQPDLFLQQPEFSPISSAFYTKPIYMLIDPLDFSGGDATPATLQDYGRVKLVGQRTAGAGGTVEEFSVRGLHMQFDYRLTTSLMYRPSNKELPYVENFGVKPDIEFAPTNDDYVSGFKNYLLRLLPILEKDLNQKQR